MVNLQMFVVEKEPHLVNLQKFFVEKLQMFMLKKTPI